MKPSEIIPNPCPEQWDQMSGSDQKRFCEKCAHNIDDITDLNLTEIDKLRANTKDKNKAKLCGMILLSTSIALTAGITSLAACSKSDNHDNPPIIPPTSATPQKNFLDKTPLAKETHTILPEPSTPGSGSPDLHHSPQSPTSKPSSSLPLPTIEKKPQAQPEFPSIIGKVRLPIIDEAPTHKTDPILLGRVSP